jgi:hypothetical protein
MRAHVGNTHFFIGREAPFGDQESNEAMLAIGEIAVPLLESLSICRIEPREIANACSGANGLPDREPR